MNKGIFISTLSTLMIAGSVCAGTAQAQVTTTTLRTERQQLVMDTRKVNADKEIQRRITSLNALMGRVNNMQRVTSDEKASLQAEIQAIITDLTNLKAKIDADTDAATLKTDKQSIVTSYRVFALVLPKAEIMAHADALLTLADQMSTSTTNFQTKIQQSGKDVSSLQPNINDRIAKIADAKTQAQNAINAVSALTPDGYPGNRTTLQSARDMLKTARLDLRTANQDLVKSNQAYKALVATK